MANNTSEAVAGELRAIMARAGVSSRDLATRLEVSPMWVTRRLRGHVALDVDDVASICTALEVSTVDVYAAAEVPA